jgi:ABC-type polysaccharide/polyol phosphate transport system ATPase subunit
MVDEAVIDVEHVSKKYAKSLKHAMFYGLIDLAKVASMPKRFRSGNFDARVSEMVEHTPYVPKLRSSEFWALQDVSFKLNRGDCVGLIGHNGAGKSTLFKIMSGIISPSVGKVTIRGRLTSLIEVGAGFHPMLSGRENIYISGAVLGMSHREIDRKIEEIVAFSGVEEFIDMPVKFYSSGMHVRLGFSVLAHLEPDIMLIDEILAVGDMEFQKKCIDRINRMRAEDMAIALVSHNLHRIESLSSYTMWLEHGTVKMKGDTAEIIEKYRSWEIEKYRQALEPAEKDKSGDERILLERIETTQLDGTLYNSFEYAEGFKVVVHYVARVRVEKPNFQLFFYTEDSLVFIASMLIDGNCPEYIEGHGSIECTFPSPMLLPRVYEIAVTIRDLSGLVDLVAWNRDTHFVVNANNLGEKIPMNGPCPVGLLMQSGVVHLDYEWGIGSTAVPTVSL